MRFMSWAAAIVAALGLMAAAPSGARADTTFTLVTAGSLPAGTYGTVSVSSIDANTLDISVTLSGTNHFATTGTGGGIEASFAFSLAGFGTIAFSSLPAIWSALSTSAGSVHMDGGGFFQYGVLFSNGGNTDGSTLDFHISATNLGLNTNNVTRVAADICTAAPNANNNCPNPPFGLTGVVVGTTAPVPAPLVGAGLPGLIAACAGLLVFARRRRQRFA